METIPPQLNEDNVLAQAFKLIDPPGTLVPGTDAHDTIRCMLRGWINQYGADRALCMARLGRKRLGRWRKFL
jgi:hypothetical protein